MLNPRYIGSMLLVALMLTTTIGISIYKHTCLASGHQGISIFMVASVDADGPTSCCTITKGACKKPATDSSLAGCCEETGSYYQLDIPQKTEEQYAYNAPLLPVIGIVNLSTFQVAEVEQSQFLPLYNNLPPPNTLSRLAQLQVYIL